MNDRMEVVCPSCGSKNVSVAQEQRQLRLPFASSVAYAAEIDQCADCDFTGDFSKSTDKNLAVALSSARCESVNVMIRNLTEGTGYSMAGIERAFELPPRTMMRWKAGDCSAGALAFLRTIATFPWTVDVADAQFDPAYANARLAQESFNAMCRMAEKKNVAARIDVIASNPYETFGTFSIRAVKPALESTSSAADVKLVAA